MPWQGGSRAGVAGGRSGSSRAFILTLLAVVIVGFSSSDDAFDAVAIGVLVVIVWLNACTAIGGAALARHAQNRDAHLA